MNANYDLIVVGGGPAGLTAAQQAARTGKKVLLIDRNKVMGGAASNAGLPSRSLRETAIYVSRLRDRGLYSIDVTIQKELTVADLFFRKKAVVSMLDDLYQKALKEDGITILRGEARFLDPHQIAIKTADEEITVGGAIILIAPGSRPLHPKTMPVGQPGLYDSDTILEIPSIPKKLIVIGGGVVGCEFACTFAALNVAVTLVHSRETILEFLDPEIITYLEGRMAVMGIDLILPDRVKKVECGPENIVHLESGAKLSADAVLFATGRLSNIEGLDLEKAGVQVGERGVLSVNSAFQTNVPTIYATGDVIGFPGLTATSKEQSRVAMAHAFACDYTDHVSSILSFGIWTIPSVAIAGESEGSLQKKGIPYVVGRGFSKENPRALLEGDNLGLVKLIFTGDDMKLAGVHLIGQEACELIHIGLTALATGATAQLFRDMCFGFPTFSETYKYATLNALEHKAKGVSGAFAS